MGTPTGGQVSKRGRVLKQPTKFSPSKMNAEAAAKRRILNPQDVTPEKTGNTDQKLEESADKKEATLGNAKKRTRRSTGGMQPKGVKEQLKALRRKKAESQGESSSEGTESEESGDYSDTSGEDESSQGSKEKLTATQGSKEKLRAPAPKPCRGSKKKTRNPHSDSSDLTSDDRVGFREVPNGGQRSAMNLAQLANQFENMDKLRALIRGKDHVLPPPSAPPPGGTTEEKLSMREMFTLFTEFAKAVRDPVAPASAPAPAPAPAVVPVPSAPATPVTVPPAPPVVAATPLTIENFERLMQAFQQNIR